MRKTLTLILLAIVKLSLHGQSLYFGNPITCHDLELNRTVKEYQIVQTFHDFMDSILIEQTSFYKDGIIKDRLVNGYKTYITGKRKKRKLNIENKFSKTSVYTIIDSTWLLIKDSKSEYFIRLTKSNLLDEVYLWCNSTDSVFNSKDCGLMIDYHYNRFDLLDSVITYEIGDSINSINHKYIYTYQNDTILIGDTLKSIDRGFNHYSYYEYDSLGNFEIHTINRPNGVSTIFPEAYNKNGLIIKDMDYTYDYDYDEYGNWIMKLVSDYKGLKYTLIRNIEYY